MHSQKLNIDIILLFVLMQSLPLYIAKYLTADLLITKVPKAVLTVGKRLRISTLGTYFQLTRPVLNDWGEICTSVYHRHGFYLS